MVEPVLCQCADLRLVATHNSLWMLLLLGFHLFNKEELFNIELKIHLINSHHAVLGAP